MVAQQAANGLLTAHLYPPHEPWQHGGDASRIGTPATNPAGIPDEINPDITKSALTQARQRLGHEPLSQLFAMSAAAWDQRHQQGRSWRGLARYAIDGSTLRTPDTPANREHFGAQEYASGVVASYPQLRLLTLTSLSTHLVRDAVFGEYGKNEMRYQRHHAGCPTCRAAGANPYAMQRCPDGSALWATYQQAGIPPHFRWRAQ